MQVQAWVLTQKVPDEDIFKESRWFETVLENLLQSPDEAVLPTEQEGQAASLWREQKYMHAFKAHFKLPQNCWLFFPENANLMDQLSH